MRLFVLIYVILLIALVELDAVCSQQTDPVEFTAFNGKRNGIDIHEGRPINRRKHFDSKTPPSSNSEYFNDLVTSIEGQDDSPVFELSGKASWESSKTIENNERSDANMQDVEANHFDRLKIESAPVLYLNNSTLPVSDALTLTANVSSLMFPAVHQLVHKLKQNTAVPFLIERLISIIREEFMKLYVFQFNTDRTRELLDDIYYSLHIYMRQTFYERNLYIRVPTYLDELLVFTLKPVERGFAFCAVQELVEGRFVCAKLLSIPPIFAASWKNTHGTDLQEWLSGVFFATMSQFVLKRIRHDWQSLEYANSGYIVKMYPNSDVAQYQRLLDISTSLYLSGISLVLYDSLRLSICGSERIDTIVRVFTSSLNGLFAPPAEMEEHKMPQVRREVQEKFATSWFNGTLRFESETAVSKVLAVLMQQSDKVSELLHAVVVKSQCLRLICPYMYLERRLNPVIEENFDVYLRHLQESSLILFHGRISPLGFSFLLFSEDELVHMFEVYGLYPEFKSAFKEYFYLATGKIDQMLASDRINSMGKQELEHAKSRLTQIALKNMSLD